MLHHFRVGVAERAARVHDQLVEIQLGTHVPVFDALAARGICLHPLDTGLHRRPIPKVILQAANRGGVLALAENELDGHLESPGGFLWKLSHVAKESTRLNMRRKARWTARAVPRFLPVAREPPLRRAVATTPAGPRAAVPRRARRALAATSARAHRCASIGRPSRG